MRNYRVSGVAVFVLLATAVGCNKTAPPPPFKAVPVTIVATSKGLVAVEIQPSTNSLVFQTAPDDSGGFIVSFPNDIVNYPPACKPIDDHTPPNAFEVCPTPSGPGENSCEVNPKILLSKKIHGYYEIKPGATCKAPTPIPYSVVHCQHCPS